MSLNRKITALILCLFIVLSGVLTTSCGKSDETPGKTEKSTDGFSDDQTDEIDRELERIKAEIEDEIRGEMSEELLEELRQQLASGGLNPSAKPFLNVADYVQPDTGKDVSDEIQMVINKNPGRTIYFPDGVYVIGKPILTSANPKSSVSLYLSANAVLKAIDGWRESEAMVRLGALENFNTIYINGSNYYFYGGTVDGNGRADGISIDSGRETAIRGVNIKDVRTGIIVKRGANNGSSDSDVRDVTITGNGISGSTGIKIYGADNTFTNIDIYGMDTGLFIKSGGNMFREIRAEYTFREGLEPVGYDQTVGFNASGGTNWFDSCSSDNYATGFLVNSSTVIYRMCSVSWSSDSCNSYEKAFDCYGMFRSTIISPTVRFREDASQRSLLTVEDEGGKGVLQNPIFDESLCDDDTYKNYILKSEE